MTFRVVQVSDPHLSAERAYCVSNLDAVVGAINEDPPDLVVATGDLALDSPDSDGDRGFARRCFDGLTAVWRALPGNHDIGDDGPDPWLGEPVTASRRDAWRAVWGDDWWTEEAGEWVLIGLNSLLFGSGLAAEQEQDAWLAPVAASLGPRPVALFLHKPPFVWSAEERRDQKTMTAAGWQRLRNALGPAAVRLIASGHLHQFRASAVDGAAMVWAPSTGFVSRGPSPFGGLKVVGAVEYRFEGCAVTWRLLRPPGMTDHEVESLAHGAESLRFAPLRPHHR